MPDALIPPQPKPFVRDDARYEAIAQRLERAAAAIRACDNNDPDLQLVMGAVAEALDSEVGPWDCDWHSAARRLFAEAICRTCGMATRFGFLDEQGVCSHCHLIEQASMEDAYDRALMEQAEQWAEENNPRCEQCGARCDWEDDEDGGAWGCSNLNCPNPPGDDALEGEGEEDA